MRYPAIIPSLKRPKMLVGVYFHCFILMPIQPSSDDIISEIRHIHEMIAVPLT